MKTLQNVPKAIDNCFKSPITWIKTNTTKKENISEGNLERKNVKSLYNFITKFYDHVICEFFFCH